MMKRVVSLILVMAVVSAASAVSFDLSAAVNGTDWDGVSAVKPGDVVSITVSNVDDIPAGQGMLNAYTQISAGSYVEGSYVTNEDDWFVAPGGGQIEGLAKGFKALFNGSTFTSAHPAGELFSLDFEINQAALDAGVVTVDALSGTWADTQAVAGADDGLPYASMDVVPEPMTVALLGIGGLFLRRRK